jgi:hypothetical protein
LCRIAARVFSIYSWGLYTLPFMKPSLLFLAAIFLPGCTHHEWKAPLLSDVTQLKPNLGQVIRIEGTARYLHVAGPSIAGKDFEIRVYPRDVWNEQMNGTKLEVTGRLEDSSHSTPPDPSLLPGEYWLSDATWKLPEVKK